MLRASLFTLTAFDTVARLAASAARLESVPPFCAVGGVSARVVYDVEYRGYRNFLRTAVGTVAARSTLDSSQIHKNIPRCLNNIHKISIYW